MKTITATELKKKLDEGTVVLVDVREPAEHQGAHIHGTHLIPLSTVSPERLPKKNQPLVLYCRSGRRSADACKQLLHKDASLDVCSLEGGIIAWQEAGFPIKTSGADILPLERQTQIVAGVCALLGTLAGALITPAYYIIPGFVGAGLIFSGITGWCGMAKLLAKMPWNQ